MVGRELERSRRQIEVNAGLDGLDGTALSLGIAAFVMTCFPIVGFLLAITATVTAVLAVRSNRDDASAISVLCINAVILALSVAALAWSIGTGLYGLVISPWPA